MSRLSHVPQLGRFGVLGALGLALLLAPTSCARWPWAPTPTAQVSDPAEAGPSAAHTDEQIQAVEQAIDADRTRLIALLSQPLGVGETLSTNPELRAIAQRLPGLEEELRVLKAQRESLAKTEANTE